MLPWQPLMWRHKNALLLSWYVESTRTRFSFYRAGVCSFHECLKICRSLGGLPRGRFQVCLFHIHSRSVELCQYWNKSFLYRFLLWRDAVWLIIGEPLLRSEQKSKPCKHLEVNAVIYVIIFDYSTFDIKTSIFDHVQDNVPPLGGRWVREAMYKFACFVAWFKYRYTSCGKRDCIHITLFACIVNLSELSEATEDDAGFIFYWRKNT